MDSFKLIEFADDNFKFNEIGRKFSKQVENTVEKGEIAHKEQFLLFHSVFKKFVDVLQTHHGLFGEGLNYSSANVLKKMEYITLEFTKLTRGEMNGLESYTIHA